MITVKRGVLSIETDEFGTTPTVLNIKNGMVVLGSASGAPVVMIAIQDGAVIASNTDYAYTWSYNTSTNELSIQWAQTSYPNHTYYALYN